MLLFQWVIIYILNYNLLMFLMESFQYEEMILIYQILIQNFNYLLMILVILIILNKIILIFKLILLIVIFLV